MKNGHSGDRLSWGDALFLYLEREGMPLNIAGVSLFEGEMSLEACTRVIESKLPLLPRYYQRVITPPLNIGFPSWEYDPTFDIRNHMREIVLRRGTETELKAVAGKILSTMMDRKRPLWDVTLVSGLKEKRCAIVVRIHHCLADGIAGVGLMNVMMDPSPEPQAVPKKKRSHPSRRSSDPLTALLDGVLSTYSDVIQRVLTAHSNVLSMGERIAAGDAWSADDFARFLPEISAPTERMFFNVTYQGPQKFAWAQVPLAEIKAIREKCGGTHNDLVLALMTATIRRYAELHGDRMKGRLLRMMVPVNVRDHQDANDLGNRISLVPVTVPMDIRSPRKLLAAVCERTEFLKRAHVAELVGLAGGLVGVTPAPLQALVGPVASLLPITPFNLVCTNVRGPEYPLYFLGHKMLEWYPYVPVGGEMALNCATLSYNGVTYFGFSGDIHAAPDLGELERLLELSFRELRQAAGIKPPHKKKTTKPKAASIPAVRLGIPSSLPPSLSPTQPEAVQRPAAREERVVLPLAAD
jgi:diacylglycerol O-acyltransferase / wax synthase